MDFQEDVVRISQYLFETVLSEIHQKHQELPPEEVKGRVISRLLWHYSLLNIFLVEHELGGDFSEWLTEKQTEGYYRDD